MNGKLTESSQALINCAETGKEARPTLKGLLIRDGRIYAANGFIAITKVLLDGESADGIGEVIIPPDAVKACKGDVELSCVETMITPKSGMMDMPGTKTVVRLKGESYDVEADATEGNYPDVMSLFHGADGQIKAFISLNTTLLKKLAKSLPDDSFVTFRIIDHNIPVEFQCMDPDDTGEPIRGIIMPGLVKTDDLKWFANKKKDE